MSRGANRTRIAALGPVSIHCPDAPSQRPLSHSKLTVLAALVAAGPNGLGGDDLGEAIWPGRHRGGAALRMAVARLRGHLSPGVLPEATDGRYRLQLVDHEVDVWFVSRLAVQGLPAELSPSLLRHLLSPVDAYEGVVPSALIEESRDAVRQAQRRLLDRLASERLELVSGSLLDHLSGHLALDPFNENIVFLVAMAQARCGDRRAALRTLSLARSQFSEFGLSLSRSIDELEQAVLHGVVEPSGSYQAETERDGLADLRRTPIVGSTANLERLLTLLAEAQGMVRVVVTGPSGVGKTRLCAELAGAATRSGLAVLYAANQPNSDVALAPMLAALPELRDRIDVLSASHLEPHARKAAVWAAITDAIDQRSRGRRVVLVVDDCQWLDTQTAELLEFVARSRFESTVLLILVGRDESNDEDSIWPSLVGAVRRLGVSEEIRVAALDLAGVSELLTQRNPALSTSMVRRLSRDLHVATGGLPGVMSAVLSVIDDELFVLPPVGSLSPDLVLDSLVADLPDQVRTVGAVAALVGPKFDLETVVAVANLGEDQVLAAVDVLVRHDLVAERTAGHFSVANLFIQAALLRGSLQSHQVRWHRRAATHFRHELHRRARHEVGALAGAVDSRVAQLLIHSATAFLEEGLYREAIIDFRLAEQHSPAALEPAVAGRLARAFDLAGMSMRAQHVRRDAFQRAIDSADHDVAVDVATSGLPESELVDGDLELVSQLRAIDPTQLDSSRRHDWACHLARQLTLIGAVLEAVDVARESLKYIGTPAQVARTVLTTRLALAPAASPSQRLASLDRAASVVDSIGTEARAEYFAVLAFDRYEAADTIGAQVAIHQLESLGTAAPPLRRWHGLLFDAMAHADAGRWAEAQKCRDVALEFGTQFGISEAENAHFAAVFADLWLDGEAHSVQPLLDDGTFPAAESVLGRAGAIATLVGSGRLETAVPLAEQLVTDLVRRTRPQGTGALAVAAEALSHSCDETARSAARRLLGARGRSLIVVGAGVVCLGPTSRYLALLADDDQTRLRHLRAAVDLADESGLDRWREICRRDLATQSI